jgi:hypothetical protein
VSDSTEEAVELFPTREEAEAIVQAWVETSPSRRGSYGSSRSSFGREQRTSRHVADKLASTAIAALGLAARVDFGSPPLKAL